MNEQLDKLTKILTDSTNVTVETYTYWHFVNALVWTGIGTACFILAFYLWKKQKEMEFTKLAIIILVGFGLLLVGSNVVNIFAPKAYAIHQILKDVRG